MLLLYYSKCITIIACLGPLEKEMATHSSIFACKISWMEPGRLQSIGSKESDMTERATSFHLSKLHCIQPRAYYATNKIMFVNNILHTLSYAVT